jgi:hypothetical protein
MEEQKVGEGERGGEKIYIELLLKRLKLKCLNKL